MSFNRLPIIIIVDAMSTARHYPVILGAHGHHCIHIQSSKNMHPRFYREFVREHYVDAFLADEIDKLNSITEQYEVLAVLPGQDPVAPLADKLASELSARYRNDAATSTKRVDKFDMIESAAEVQLRVPSCKKIHNEMELQDFLAQSRLYPLVVKPPRSAGVDLVQICCGPMALVSAICAIFNNENVYGAKNHYAVVQSYLSGQEYMIDTVSFCGAVRLISVWKVTRANASSPYPLYTLSLDLDSHEAVVAFNYVKQVLDAVGHHFGPAHCEVKIDEQGPALIEINPRLHGSLDVSAVEKINGVSQISHLAKCLNGDSDYTSPSAQSHVLKAYFISPYAGAVTADFDLSAFFKIETFHSIDVNLRAGRALQKTTTLTTSAGFIYFTGTEEKLMLDYEKFRNLEKLMWDDAIEQQLISQ